MTSALDSALAYAALGLRTFPVTARKIPLIKWRDGATTDPATIEGLWRKWPHAEPGWALPAGVVVVDVDIKNGKNGYSDFARLEGCDPRTVGAPMATTPSGGLQVFYAATKPYVNRAPIAPGLGIDTRTEGGLVVLPSAGNGRQWLKSLDTPMPPAPAWLDCVVKKEPLILAPKGALKGPGTSETPADPCARRKALALLDRACAAIVAAPVGERHNTLNRECFTIGGIIGRGDIAYVDAYGPLLAAAQTVRHVPPWRNLERTVARMLEDGLNKPLEVSPVDLFVRAMRARLAARKAAVS
jgi:hypothetical protein